MNAARGSYVLSLAGADLSQVRWWNLSNDILAETYLGTVTHFNKVFFMFLLEIGIRDGGCWSVPTMADCIRYMQIAEEIIELGRQRNIQLDFSLFRGCERAICNFLEAYTGGDYCAREGIGSPRYSKPNIEAAEAVLAFMQKYGIPLDLTVCGTCIRDISQNSIKGFGHAPSAEIQFQLFDFAYRHDIPLSYQQSDIPLPDLTPPSEWDGAMMRLGLVMGGIVIGGIVVAGGTLWVVDKSINFLQNSLFSKS